MAECAPPVQCAAPAPRPAWQRSYVYDADAEVEAAEAAVEAELAAAYLSHNREGASIGGVAGSSSAQAA